MLVRLRGRARSAFRLASAGRTAKARRSWTDYATHRRDPAARRAGGFQALPAKDIFDVEYWDLEQAKLKRRQAPGLHLARSDARHRAAPASARPPVAAFLARGRPVVGLDLDAKIGRFTRARISWGCSATSPMSSE